MRQHSNAATRESHPILIFLQFSRQCACGAIYSVSQLGGQQARRHGGEVKDAQTTTKNGGIELLEQEHVEEILCQHQPRQQTHQRTLHASYRPLHPLPGAAAPCDTVYSPSSSSLLVLHCTSGSFAPERLADRQATPELEMEERTRTTLSRQRGLSRDARGASAWHRVVKALSRHKRVNAFTAFVKTQASQCFHPCVLTRVS
jgi:hypothetical protein